MNHQKLIELIERTSAQIEQPLSEEIFNQHALELFEHQYDGIESYRNFCDGRGVDPGSANTYLDVPPVPTDVFKHVRLCTTTESEHVFRTSGTTQGKRGEHHFGSLAVYAAAAHPTFDHYVQTDDTEHVFILAPSHEDLPDSSLSWMLSTVAGEHALNFVPNTANDWGVLREQLNTLQTPVSLLGTAFAFVAFFESCDDCWKLPKGSRVMETGGFKGRTREVTREDLYHWFEERLGIPATHCIAEYSMTELSSQAYSNVLTKPTTWRDTEFVVPPWVRVDLLDPSTMKPSKRGLIRWFDLANVDSVCSVLTSDIGEKKGDGFVLVGRASESELRGCSLTIEEIIA